MPKKETSQTNSLSSPTQNNEWFTNLSAPSLVDSWMDQPAYACMVVDQEGIIQKVNDTFLTWAKVNRCNVLFQNISDQFSAKDYARLKEGMTASLNGESRVKELYPASLFPQQNARKICISHYPLQSVKSDEIVGVLFCMDIEPTLNVGTINPWLNQDQQKILDSLDAYLVLLDTQMRLRSFNKKFYNSVLKRLPFELKEGMSFLKMVPDEHQDRYVIPFEKALKGETVSQELKMNSVWWEMKHTPVYEDGEITAVAISAIKIDDWVRMRNEFKLLTQELMRSNAELQQFAYITSHNLRAPVVNLVSLLGFVDRRQIGDAMNQQIFHKVDASALRLEDTLQDLVQVVAIKDRREVSFQRVNFRQLLDQLLEAMSFELIESESMIQADFGAVREVIYPHNYLWSIIQNLLSNAMKYKRPGIKPEIRISSFREKGFVGIRIEDNGLGLDLDTYGDRLFGLYQRFHEGDGLKGKGLGLYIVKSQVESLDGRIEVESKVDQGSCFHIYLRDLRPL
ncbi:MAG: ATP-binding protein [Bacteroidia bacterium]